MPSSAVVLPMSKPQRWGEGLASEKSCGSASAKEMCGKRALMVLTSCSELTGPWATM